MATKSVTAKEIATLQAKYPGSVLVFVEKGAKSDLPPLDKQKYIVPRDMVIGSFLFMIRKRISLPPEKAIYIFINNTLPPSTAKMGELFTLHGKDGYLRMVVAAESTFG
jgi:GABA(A) receptor-associated protein